MGRFVIKRGDEYVSVPGAARSYTRDVRNARLFGSIAQARLDCCGNERIVAIGSEFKHLYWEPDRAH